MSLHSVDAACNINAVHAMPMQEQLARAKEVQKRAAALDAAEADLRKQVLQAEAESTAAAQHKSEAEATLASAEDKAARMQADVHDKAQQVAAEQHDLHSKQVSCHGSAL